MIKYKIWTFLLLLMLLLALLIFAYMNPVNKTSNQKTVDETEVLVWQTTGDQADLLEKKDSLYFSNQHSPSLPTVAIEPNTAYQQMDGFGAAVTGSTAYLLQNEDDSERNSILTDLFTSKGINLSIVRHTIGSSDFSVDVNGNPSSYTYNDTNGEPDYDMNYFSIKKDKDVVGSLQDILTLNKDIQVLGTPWSAPAWMKFGEKTLNGWYLDYTNDKVYKAYADYFVRYVKAYKSNGIDISAVTIQNEPEFTSANYPSMSMGAEEQAKFIGQYLGPAFQANNLETKIIGFDHNWDSAVQYTSALFEDSTALKYIDGTAFHCYEGTPAAMAQIHENFPSKHIYLTECSSGKWSESFADNFSWQMSNLMIGGPRNWAKAVLMWNIALDENNGPVNGGCSICTGLLTIDKKTGTTTKNAEYYALGHASKFVQPHAVRIYSSNFPGTIETVAYQNPDKSIILLALNPMDKEKSFQIETNGTYFTYSLPPKSAVTFSWQP
ncbi:glycoside hydrolase family 30 protein [Bacillus sp. Au-Bac7]|uniref:glycoside hydrolase family 30 protein n=1 Tax=Bacillus sp. Au-Bac7 TaxID=2906458 RepID=UPI001E3AC2F6|nr:glycoside hydrolase family 30 beta sandwich domain-containing protein [Bacillus sp. Au-Bac7]MCE4049311.1 beta-1,6-glucanase [Bacillus sp. Au-Bac7]